MEYIIKLICKKNLTDKNLKVNETVWVDNVFGKETFTRIKKNACKFISTVRADKLVKKINDNGNFYASVVRIYMFFDTNIHPSQYLSIKVFLTILNHSDTIN